MRGDYKRKDLDELTGLKRELERRLSAKCRVERTGVSGRRGHVNKDVRGEGSVVS